jgi:superfamily II DNA or RNA helicase
MMDRAIIIRGMEQGPLRLLFDAGTIVVTGATKELLDALPGCQADPRTGAHRAEGRFYRALVEHLLRLKIPFVDEARKYDRVTWSLKSQRRPFPHQSEALETWWKQRGRGIVVLPTGTGKTFVAVLAIERAARPTLVVTPTIELLNQWFAELEESFGPPVGLMGGGEYSLQPITVTTYDSAYIHLERWGNLFGLLVFDECHHLPGPTYLEAARGSIAPFRLGLTATPERGDGQEALLPELIGPIVYRREIRELSGEFLAEYRTERVYVALPEDEQRQYDTARQIYRGFVEQLGISMGGPNGWRRFIQESCRSADGRAAFRAYREQKRLAQAAPAKLKVLQELLDKHAGQRILVFTADNATVYRIARRLLVPAITHQTRPRERRLILQRFHAGEYPILVTSQVLNEGVDVPAASMGIILSGTGSVREHVQRLGRLLRKHGDKQAILYEVVTSGTAEEFTSDRRRQHDAYQADELIQ